MPGKRMPSASPGSTPPSLPRISKANDLFGITCLWQAPLGVYVVLHGACGDSGITLVQSVRNPYKRQQRLNAEPHDIPGALDEIVRSQIHFFYRLGYVRKLEIPT